MEVDNGGDGGGQQQRWRWMTAKMELDDSKDAGTYQASLFLRGTEEQPALYLDESNTSTQRQGDAQAREDGDTHDHPTGAVLYPAL